MLAEPAQQHLARSTQPWRQPAALLAAASAAHPGPLVLFDVIHIDTVVRAQRAQPNAGVGARLPGLPAHHVHLQRHRAGVHKSAQVRGAWCGALGVGPACSALQPPRQALPRWCCHAAATTAPVNCTRKGALEPGLTFLFRITALPVPPRPSGSALPSAQLLVAGL